MIIPTSKLTKALLILATTSLCHGLAPAARASQVHDTQLSRLVDLKIPAPLFEFGCESVAIDEDDDKSLAKLQSGICAIHSTRPPAGDQPQVRNRLREAAIQLASAQTSGLPNRTQNYAVFLEGIANCRVAASSARRTLRDPNFCPARSAALTAFQNVLWDSFSVNYLNSDGSENPQIWNALVNEMADCYQDILAVEYDASCGVSATTPNLDQTVTERVVAVFHDMFEGSRSPVDAIIKRKIDSSTDVLKRARKSLWGDENLESRPSGEVNAETLLAKASYVAGRATILDKAIRDSAKEIDSLKADYREAILTADQIYQEYSRLKDGIYVEAPDKRWADRLAENQNILQATVQSVKKAESGKPSAWDQLANLPDDLTTLLAYTEDRKSSIRSLCQIYFCELMSSQSLSANGDTSIACKDTRLKGNPLCVTAQTPLSNIVLTSSHDDGTRSSVKVVDLCREAGFGKDDKGVERYLKLGMTPPERTACFKQLF